MMRWKGIMGHRGFDEKGNDEVETMRRREGEGIVILHLIF